MLILCSFQRSKPSNFKRLKIPSGRVSFRFVLFCFVTTFLRNRSEQLHVYSTHTIIRFEYHFQRERERESERQVCVPFEEPLGDDIYGDLKRERERETLIELKSFSWQMNICIVLVRFKTWDQLYVYGFVNHVEETFFLYGLRRERSVSRWVYLFAEQTLVWVHTSLYHFSCLLFGERNM